MRFKNAKYPRLIFLNHNKTTNIFILHLNKFELEMFIEITVLVYFHIFWLQHELFMRILFFLMFKPYLS